MAQTVEPVESTEPAQFQPPDREVEQVESAELSEAERTEMEADDAVSWQRIQDKMRNGDGRRALFFDLFIQQYGVPSMVDALVMAPAFVEEYLVDGLDYKAFIQAAGLADDLTNEEYAVYVEHSMQEDIAEGVSMIQHLVLLIGMEVGLTPAQLQDAMPSGGAIRIVPKCAYLNTLLPGAVNAARALKHRLPSVKDQKDPFVDEEAAKVFVEEYGEETWENVQIAVNADGAISSSCTGCMRVEFTSPADIVTIVSMRPISITGEAPHPAMCSKVTEFTAEGPDVLLEVENSIGALMEPGMLIDGDWFELESGSWLLDSVVQLRPGLRRDAEEKKLEEDKADERAQQQHQDRLSEAVAGEHLTSQDSTSAGNSCADAGGELSVEL